MANRQQADKTNDEGPLIFISAAEPSADVHGASLIQAVHALCPSARFVGVAGPRMVEAGCEPIFDMTSHAAMLLGALKVVGKAMEMLRVSTEHLRSRPFDAAVVIDSPTLHLRLAKRATRAGVPVLYYIAPQMWAWGAWRLPKLRRDVKQVAVILPFEEAYFRQHDVDATYVGHPSADQWARRQVDDAVVDKIRATGSPVVALLPGSRKHVVSEVLSGQLDVAEAVADAVPGVAFGVSVANDQVAPLVDEALAGRSISVSRYPEHRAELVRAADLVLVASGTTTLEIALEAKPMIVMYNASRLFYQLVGRWLIHIPHLSLPNILAGREIVPEFMPYYTDTAPIAEQAIALLQSDEAKADMSATLAEVVEPLLGTDASANTARMLLEMARHESDCRGRAGSQPASRAQRH